MLKLNFKYYYLTFPLINWLFILTGNKVFLISFFFFSIPLIIKLRIYNKIIMMYTFLILITLLLNILYVQYDIGGDIIFFISSLIISYSCLKNNATKYIFEIPFYITLIYLLSLHLILGFQYTEFNSLGINSNKSINYISAILTFNFIGYLFSRCIRNKPISVIFLLLYAYTSYFLYSRTSVIIALFIVIVCLPYISIFRKNKFLLVSLLFLILPLTIFLSIEQLHELILNTKWKNGFDTPRYSLWEDYLKSLTIFSILLGTNLSDIPSIASYSSNPHNSLISLLSSTGIIGFIATMGLYIYNTLLMVKNKNYFLIAISSLMLLRAFFDKLLFFGTYDYYFSIFLLYFIFHKRNTTHAPN